MTNTVLLTTDPRGVATVMLNRPEKRNALSGELIAQLQQTLEQLHQDAAVRVVVLTGAGTGFCAGADLKHMQRMAHASEAENFSDGLAIANCMRTLNELSKPVIARINGDVFGGGMGLVACADIAIAHSQARFCLSEVRLGLSIAVIAPYIVPVLGPRQARRLILTGARINAEEAVRLGLIHQHVDAQQLDQAVDAELELLLQGAPLAQQASKQLIREAMGTSAAQDDVMNARNAKLFARLRLSPEGREGLQAFMEKRKPHWAR